MGEEKYEHGRVWISRSSRPYFFARLLLVPRLPLRLLLLAALLLRLTALLLLLAHCWPCYARDYASSAPVFLWLLLDGWLFLVRRLRFFILWSLGFFVPVL